MSNTLAKARSGNIINDAFRNAKASLEIENLRLPEGAVELIMLKQTGKISQSEFLRSVALLARRG